MGSCHKCKAPIRSTDRFCANCGASLVARCATCGNELLKDVAACPSCETSPPPAFDRLSDFRGGARLPGVQKSERRLVTVLFADIVGSTRLAERLDPEDYADVLQAYHVRSTDVIEANDGCVSQFLGDGILALFGYPVAGENDPERAVRAALKLIEAAATVRSAIGPLQTRVGIATGIVVVGAVYRTAGADEHPLAGDTPNLAARLQAIAKPGSIVIAPATKRLVGQLFDLHPLGPQQISGFTAPIEAWEVKSDKGLEDRFSALRRPGSSFVGRKAELAVLTKAWEQARGGHGRCVVLSGIAGIGKSRLFKQFQAHIATTETSDAVVPLALDLHGAPHHANTALFPVAALLRRWAGFEPGDGEPARRAKFRSLLSLHGLDVEGPLSAALAALLELGPSNEWPEVASMPRERRLRTLEAVHSLILAAARRNPVVMHFEDLQWMDASTSDLLARLVASLRQSPIMLVVARRIEGDEAFCDEGAWRNQPAWAGSPEVEHCHLGGLDAAASHDLLMRMEGSQSLPSSLVGDILRRGEGIPLYIEELTRDRIEAGPTAAPATAEHRAPAAPLPDQLRGALVARLDRVGPAKELAQIAAVVGREFTVPLLAALSGLPVEHVARALPRLVEASIIAEHEPRGSQTYTFRHALIQDAAYGSLLRRRRRQLHLTIAESLEAGSSAGAYVSDEFVAAHFARAGALDRSIAVRKRGAEKALARGAQVEAGNLLQQALADLAVVGGQTELRPLELELTMALASALSATKGYASDEVERLHLRSRELCIALDRKDVRFNVEFGLMFTNFVKGNLDRASVYAEDLEQHAGNHPKRPIVDAHLARGMILLSQGRFDDARLSLETCVSLTDAATDEPNAFSHGLNPGIFGAAKLAHACAFQGYMARAESVIERALAVARMRATASASVHVLSLVTAIAFACRIYLLARRPQRVKALAAELVSLARCHQYAYFVIVGEILTTWSHAALAQSRNEMVTHARAMCEALDALDRTGTGLGNRGFYLNAAEIFIQLGLKSDALLCLEKATGIDVRGSESWMADVQRILGGAIALDPDPDDIGAEQCFLSAIRIAREQCAGALLSRACVSYGNFLIRKGRQEEARTCVEQQLRHSIDSGLDIFELSAFLKGDCTEYCQAPLPVDGR